MSRNFELMRQAGKGIGPKSPRVTIDQDEYSARQLSTGSPALEESKGLEWLRAIGILQKSGHPDAKIGDDFGGDEETVISGQFDRPVIVHRYPAALKAFYAKRDPADDSLALCMDVLAPEGYGEIIGGSQRMASYELLLERIHQHELPEEAFR